MDDIPPLVDSSSPKLMDKLRADLRARGYALTTERTYLHWIKRLFIFIVIVIQRVWEKLS